MKIMVMCAFAIILLIGCDTVDETLPSQDIIEQSSVLVQSVLLKTSTSVAFKIVAGKPSSCSVFWRAEQTVVDSVVFIKVFHHYPIDAGCLPVLSSYDAEITVSNLPSRKRYTFKFWASDSRTVDTVVVF